MLPIRGQACCPKKVTVSTSLSLARHCVYAAGPVRARALWYSLDFLSSLLSYMSSDRRELSATPVMMMSLDGSRVGNMRTIHSSPHENIKPSVFSISWLLSPPSPLRQPRHLLPIFVMTAMVAVILHRCHSPLPTLFYDPPLFLDPLRRSFRALWSYPPCCNGSRG